MSRDYFKVLSWGGDDTADFTYRGRQWRARLQVDTAMGAPWSEHDGHGPVSEWTTRAKKPGELVLSQDRGESRRLYDLEEANRIAKADGWGLCDAELAKLAAKLGRAPKPGEVRAAAVRADYKRLRGWCEDRWTWVGVIVCRLDVHGEEREPSASLWGIESDSGDYLSQVTYELARECMADRRPRELARAAA